MMEKELSADEAKLIVLIRALKEAGYGEFTVSVIAGKLKNMKQTFYQE